MRIARNLLLAGAALIAVGCGDMDATQDDDLATTWQEIVNGLQPNSIMYTSTVGVGSGGLGDIWCSGTLVANATNNGSGGAAIMTAAHCVDGESLSTLFVHLGCGTLSPTTGVQNGCPVRRNYTVSSYTMHPTYDRRWGTGDIAMIRLNEAIPRCDDPGVNPATDTCANAAGLPPEDFFNNGHIGSLALNFAGFGTNPAGGTAGDTKLQVGDWDCDPSDPWCVVVDSYGCLDYGCRKRENAPAEQVSYVQQAPPEPGIGPCFGDSGGPAYVSPSDVPGAATGPGSFEAYVVGVTTFGDAVCAEWGTSTRVDHFRSWIDDFIGVAECASDTDCDDGNDCTDDTCVDGACQTAHNTDACDDGDLCTVGDACAGGSCQGAPVSCNGDACNDADCNPATGECETTPVDCDDGNVCTTETGCDVDLGCQYADNSNSCDNGDACAGDLCIEGNCQGATCSCASSGDACNSNGDCCSNKCRRGTCRGN